ncbi:hypothetical protein M272_08605 [Vibrio natriegens NBRC 15636 = ATCC 14048 = DSM 759]|nr:hypothetical protein M272_08605 [Vibrio natriegens NBRC 15636 = ATCC 14048 = DSM 759]
MISFVLSLISSFTQTISSFWAGIPIWIAAFFLLPNIKKHQRNQVIVLFLMGLFSLIFALFHNASLQYILIALEANQKVINLLVAVGFLKVLTDRSADVRPLPTGRFALFRTLVGTHLFGSVLNMSSVIIVGDRLARQGQVAPMQGLILLRAFCICAFWSPFFAAMGLTLTVAPGAQLTTLIIYGIPLTIAAISITTWELYKRPQSKSLHGFPMAVNSLWLPCTLAIVVITFHEFYPSINVLTLVSTTTVMFTALFLCFRTGINQARFELVQHIKSGISNSKNEIVLFAAAAMLASGIAALLSSLNLNLAPQHFGYLEAGFTVIVLVVLAMTGMHPVTGVTLAGSILATHVSDPNLLGLAMLMGWSLGIGLSPFSGVQISIQSRYDIRARALLKLNWQYAITMILICFAVLWLYTVTNQ